MAEEKERELWSSRWAFYFAAVGAAVGFGNVWRFPALSFSYGGGAFFIPYLMALFLIGIPILFLEIGWGQYLRTSHIGVFGNFNKRCRGVGLGAVTCAYLLVTYYSVLIAWVMNGFFHSFTDDAPWRSIDDSNNGEGGVTADDAVKYFLGYIIGGDTVSDDGNPTRIVWANVGYSCLTWFLIFLGTGFGAEWTGKITYGTMGLPIIILFIFLGRAVTLPGASEGIYQYIGQWDMSVLTEQGDVWSTAVTQIFFSIGVTFGTMAAFGSFCNKNEPAFINSCVISLANSCFSFISGLAVFATLGYLSEQSNVPIADLPFAGFALVFGTWPVILSTLPGGIHWVRLLFFNLFLLGIDSGFGLTEAIIAATQDSTVFEHTPKWKISAAYCMVGWLLSWIYCTDAGLSFLDVVDFYINFVMLIFGFLETFACGWMYAKDEIIAMTGKKAFFWYLAANFLSVVVASGVWFGVPPEKGAVWAGFVALIGIAMICSGVTLYLLHKKSKQQDSIFSFKELVWAVTFQNMGLMKERLEPHIRRVPWVWCILVKQFIPHILIILFVNLAASETDSGEPIFSGYGGYDMAPYQVLGILTFIFVTVIFLVGFVFPDFYQWLDLTNRVDDTQKTLHADDADPSKTTGHGDATEQKNIDEGDDDEESDGKALESTDDDVYKPPEEEAGGGAAEKQDWKDDSVHT